MISLRITLFVLLPLVFGCQTVPSALRGSTYYHVPEVRRAEPATSAAWALTFPKVSRRECLGLAEAYLNHAWKATSANVRHGTDSKGIRIDTPDSSYQPGRGIPGWWMPDLWNRGIPYQWGGFCTLQEFDAGVAAGRAAGDVYTTQKRRLLDDAVSDEAVGIDCSGFISRCWKLPRSFSTRELPRLCLALPSFDDLQPGDILNTHNAHVLLFAGWLDSSRTQIVAYETGCPPTWKVVKHGLKRLPLEQAGYQPFRYRSIAPD